MDFDFDETQKVIAASAADVLAGQEGGDAAWQALAKAGLVALTLPGRLGGDDLGVLEAAVLLTEVGRRAADVPALATIMLGALPVVRWGSGDLQDLVLAGVGDGSVLLTAGVRERSTGMPAVPATTASLDAAGSGTVTGTKIGVAYAGEAAWILVPAAVAGGGAGRRRPPLVPRPSTRCGWMPRRLPASSAPATTARRRSAICTCWRPPGRPLWPTVPWPARLT